MSDEFESLDASEKAAVEAALNRCRALAGQIESELRKKRPGHLLDKALLVDLCVSLEHAVDVLQKTRKKKKKEPSVDTPPAPAVKGFAAAPLVISGGDLRLFESRSCKLKIQQKLCRR